MKNNIYPSYQKLASLYDKAYGKKFYIEYANFINNLIYKNKINNPLILDLACGTGSLIKELNRKFNDIEGVDASVEMLQIAKIKNPKNKFYRQSFQNLNLAKKYSVITCTFDSINYLLTKKDLYRTIQNISQHLNNNGLFIFDFNTIYKKIDPKFTNGNVVYYNSIKNNFWNVKIEITKGDRIYIEKHKERLYTLKDLKKILEKFGIKIIELYSDFDKKINEQNKSERLFVISRKIK